LKRDNAWDKWLEEQLTLPRQKEVIGVFGILFALYLHKVVLILAALRRLEIVR